jgi:hypothetical protein
MDLVEGGAALAVDGRVNWTALSTRVAMTTPIKVMRGVP